LARLAKKPTGVQVNRKKERKCVDQLEGILIFRIDFNVQQIHFDDGDEDEVLFDEGVLKRALYPSIRGTKRKCQHFLTFPTGGCVNHVSAETMENKDQNETKAT
jgi:hypothetical protein